MIDHPMTRDDLWEVSRVKIWELKIPVFPEKCWLSNKRLWGKRAYRGVQWIHGPGGPIKVTYWIEKSAFIIWNLKGKS